MTRRSQRVLVLILGGILLSQVAAACNIPVFRYALERWEPDHIQIIVFHQMGLNEEHRDLMESVKADAATSLANAIVLDQPVNEEMEPQLKSLWDTLDRGPSDDQPAVVIRTRVGRGEYVNIWTGLLNDLNKSGLLNSPAREELASRLLGGDSGVWIVLKSADDAKNQEVIDLLETSLPEIAKTIPFPEGIGLPGSELYSAIPLDMRFSVLTISADNPDESFLANWLKAIRPQEFANGEPLVVPVFGRGRVLEVIPGSVMNEGLLEELCMFLCGACSCQVKELNPGFDLLMSTNWINELYGEEIPEIPKTEPGQQVSDDKPQMVVIPTGQVQANAANSDETRSETVAPIEEHEVQAGSPSATHGHSQFPKAFPESSWLLIVFVCLITCVVGVAGLRNRVASA